MKTLNRFLCWYENVSLNKMAKFCIFGAVLLILVGLLPIFGVSDSVQYKTGMVLAGVLSAILLPWLVMKIKRWQTHKPDPLSEKRTPGYFLFPKTLDSLTQAHAMRPYPSTHPFSFILTFSPSLLSPFLL